MFPWHESFSYLLMYGISNILPSGKKLWRLYGKSLASKICPLGQLHQFSDSGGCSWLQTKMYAVDICCVSENCFPMKIRWYMADLLGWNFSSGKMTTQTAWKFSRQKTEQQPKQGKSSSLLSSIQNQTSRRRDAIADVEKIGFPEKKCRRHIQQHPQERLLDVSHESELSTH